MGQTIDYDRTAAILVEAIYYGVSVTAARWGVSVRTIDNYRRRLNTDAELADIFAFKKREFEANWAEEIPRNRNLKKHITV